MPSLRVNGVNLYYERIGSGQPILFVHGIPTDFRAWGAQVKALPDKYQTITYSRRMAKPNQNEEAYLQSTIENNAADLVALIEELRASPVHLVGHSYGGFVAAYLAAGRPDLLRTLTLIDPAVSTILVKDRKNPLQLLLLLLTSPSAALSARRFQSKSLNPSLAAFDRGDFDTALRLNLDGIMNRDGSFEGFPEEVRAMLKENEKTVGELAAELPPFGKEDAPRIGAPTLLINGAASPRFFHAINRRLARAIPKSETAVISTSAHFPHIENASEFNARLLEFLQRHS